jgi:hypothetical protein
MAPLLRDTSKRDDRKIRTSEQRRRIGHRLRRTGTITFAGSGHDCTVRNISGTGASLDISDRISIPPHFRLLVGGVIDRTCRVVLRKPGRIVVDFLR